MPCVLTFVIGKISAEPMKGSQSVIYFGDTMVCEVKGRCLLKFTCTNDLRSYVELLADIHRMLLDLA